GNNKWQLKWNDEFDYPDILLDNAWYSANGAQTWILCSRWRENAVVSNGSLKLQNRKEERGGQSWTSGSIWTKQQFQYGYYECRYKYAAATGTNNSFWLMSSTAPTVGKKFEIDINEGHYPSDMATNIHNWTDITTNPTTGAQTHPSSSKTFSFKAEPDVTIQLEIPVTTRKVRLTSNYPSHFHIQEFRVYNVNAAGYPSAMSATADNDKVGLVNFARDAQTTITASGVYGTGYEIPKATDGSLNNHWVSQTAGVKWLEFEFAADKTIGCIQFVSGWLNGSSYSNILDDYKVQYYSGNEWFDIQSVVPTDAAVNFGRDYHYFGLNWTADSLQFFCDGKKMRSVKNDFCYSPAPLYLSCAIIAWAGAVTDAINGTQMEVDYVRIYDPLPANQKPNCIINGGFENYQSTTDWQYLKETGNTSTYALVKSDPIEKLVSMRINAKASSNPYGTYMTQRIAIPSEGQYELRFKARSSNVTTENNKFRFKIANYWNTQSDILNDTTTKWVTPTSAWQSYSYKMNLKEDYSAQITFGFANLGTFDLDSVALTRVGDILAAVQPIYINKNNAELTSFDGNLVIKSETAQSFEIFNIDGSLYKVKEVPAGESTISMTRKGLYIVRLRNQNSFVSKKVLI
ncbi:MAG: family 16 glycosylhydrolase, partial [Paludibacter sp.]